MEISLIHMICTLAKIKLTTLGQYLEVVHIHLQERLSPKLLTVTNAIEIPFWARNNGKLCSSSRSKAINYPARQIVTNKFLQGDNKF